MGDIWYSCPFLFIFTVIVKYVLEDKSVKLPALSFLIKGRIPEYKRSEESVVREIYVIAGRLRIEIHLLMY